MEFAARVGIRSLGIETYPSQESLSEEACMARYASGDDLAFQRPLALERRQDQADAPEASDAANLLATDAARAAIEALPESQRVVVHLHLAEHLSFEQIAEVLGVAPDVVRERAKDAYGRLQRELKDYVRSTNKP
jgi:RNA polymerase sigma factor (sigma-70 family)